jgi:hypothetical protein
MLGFLCAVLPSNCYRTARFVPTSALPTSAFCPPLTSMGV